MSLIQWNGESLSDEECEKKIAAMSDKDCERVTTWMSLFLLLLLCFTLDWRLYLYENKLTRIPDGVQRFQNLHTWEKGNVLFVSFSRGWTRLHLYKNHLTALPDWMGKLRHLTTLVFLFLACVILNIPTGFILETINWKRSLTGLAIWKSWQREKTLLFLSFFRLSKFVSLSLSNNLLSSALPASCLKLKNLSE